ncbi:MAG TPA: sterol desaturase family protein [Chitinophagales bacterium]|nr:sterol desaturase family protein [Chitinophagales bacterium]
MVAITATRRLFRPDQLASFIDWSIVVLFFLSGLFHPNPTVYYKSMASIFAIIIIPLLTFCYLVYLFSERNGERIQGERRKDPLIAQEIFGTTRAAFVVACMAAWPAGMYKLGMPTGLVWTIEEMGLTWWMVVIQMWAGIVAVDAMTYWKHRLLHTRAFFPFHKHHHSFRDPTPFAGFAVGPLETLLTFWPLLLICLPEAKHFAPLYFTAIVSFVFLNLYLHCGVTFGWLEKLLPRMWLNSSAWHNIHHSDVNANFGEVSFIWDKLCKTSKQDMLARKKKVS